MKEIDCISASKYSMEECTEAEKLKDCRWGEILKSAQGTTTVAIRIKEGIIVAVDSRSTNGEFITSEDKVKLFSISENMVYTTAGSCYDCDRLTDHVEIKMKSAKDKPPVSVSEAAKMVHEYLESTPKDDVLCQSLVAGYDKQNGFQIYRIDVERDKDSGKDKSDNDPVETFAACGSGKWHAIDILKTHYKSTMSLPEAVDLALRALYQAAFLDRHSGGDFKVYHVTENTYREIASCGALEAYDRYFDIYKMHRSTLFLLCPRQYTPPFYVSELQECFEQYDGWVTVKAAHCVAIKKHFSFHRLVFESQEEADQVYSQVGVIEPMPKRRLNQLVPSPPKDQRLNQLVPSPPKDQRLNQLVPSPPKDQVISEFTHGIYYKKRPLYVLEKSRKNLDIIRGME